MTSRPVPCGVLGTPQKVPGVALLSWPLGGLLEPRGHQTHLTLGSRETCQTLELSQAQAAQPLTRCQGRCRPAGAKQPCLLGVEEAQGPGLHPQSWGAWRRRTTEPPARQYGQDTVGWVSGRPRDPCNASRPPLSPGRPAGPRPIRKHVLMAKSPFPGGEEPLKHGHLFGSEVLILLS